MCYHAETTFDLATLKKKYKNKITEPIEDYSTKGITYCNGFSKPIMPVITQDEPDLIQPMNWFLIPSWTKNENLYKYNTLNAKAETVHDKASFKSSIVSRRCIVPITSFYEWRWEDDKGKNKTKYKIWVKDQKIFGLAGIYDSWTNNETGEVIKSFAVLTTEANEMMAFIHNKKKRMPVILSNENEWLSDDYKNQISSFDENNMVCEIV